MLNVVIVENDSDQAEGLAKAVRAHRLGEVFEVSCLQSAAEFEERVTQQCGIGAIDILLMDIALGDVDGVELVKRLVPNGSKTQVIYVTGFQENCTRVYQSNHVYFLVKPFYQSDLNDALDKAIENLGRKSESPFSLTVGGSVVRIDPQEVVYVESDRRKVRVHMRDGVREAYGTLSRIASELPASFVQCHKSFLVNMAYISELKPDEAVLATGDSVPVSQKRRKAAKEAFLLYLRLA